jgi:hypothetical protein
MVEADALDTMDPRALSGWRRIPKIPLAMLAYQIFVFAPVMPKTKFY